MALEEQVEKVIDGMLAQKTRLMGEAFELCTKLNVASYKHPRDQLKDMLKIGKLAVRVDTIWKAVDAMRGRD